MLSDSASHVEVLVVASTDPYIVVRRQEQVVVHFGKSAPWEASVFMTRDEARDLSAALAYAADAQKADNVK